MKKITVDFKAENGTIKRGVIMDKVKVLIVGTSSSFDNYVIVDYDKKIHIVNPINLVSLDKM